MLMIYAALILHIHASLDASDLGFDDLGHEDHIHLLQVQASKHNRTAMDSRGVNNKYVFGSCANFGGASDIVGVGAFNPQAQDNTFGFCRCWGDTHCNSVPFDAEQSSSGDTQGMGHYQYDGPGVSRYAKAADGSWEIQIFQCGTQPAIPNNFHPTGQVGIAVKVGGTVVEVGMAPRGKAHFVQCYVNGVRKPDGYEVHLPTGFHFKCPEAVSPFRNGRQANAKYGTFCAVKDGQFVAHTNQFMSGNQCNQVLAVPKNVDVQAANTVCYDPVSKNGPIRSTGLKEIATTAIVPAEEVIFSQKMIDFMSSVSKCHLQTPPQSGVPAGEPADPQLLCAEHGPDAWQHAQDVCSPLQEQHLAFYNDCLVDECVRFGDKDADAEVAEIEEIAEADEPEVADEVSAVGDPHISSSSGRRFDLLPSMLKHSH